MQITALENHILLAQMINREKKKSKPKVTSTESDFFFFLICSFVTPSKSVST